MKRTRQVLVMTLVATAMCADRVVTAAPEVRAQIQSTADPIARLANHLGSKLSCRRVVPAVRLHRCTREQVVLQPCSEAVAPAPAGLHDSEGSPFQFRLPPPLA